MGAILQLRAPSVGYDSKSDLRKYSREQLMNSAMSVVKIEHAATIEAIRHFSEINRRKLYLEYGFSSLFDMLTKHFGYCRASAQVRINSMRLVNDIPEVEQKIENGELTLTAASQVQSFLVAEKKDQKIYTSEEKLDLVQTCAGKSTREIERELAVRNPKVFKRESVRVVSESHSRMNITVSNDVAENLEKVRALLSHIDPNMSYDDLLRRMSEIALDQLDPVRKAKKREKKIAAGRVHAHELKRGRYIAANSRHAVWSNHDGNGCEYVDTKTGKRCESKKFLQIDHIIPYSSGGSNEVSNLRVLCGAHNRCAYRNR
jgi:5-methylcytosine-specific restriction endonuclease McrA